MINLNNFITERLKLTKNSSVGYESLKFKDETITFPCTVHILRISGEEDVTLYYWENHGLLYTFYLDENKKFKLVLDDYSMNEIFINHKSASGYLANYGTVIVSQK